MKVTVAIDSLKGSLSSIEAGEAIKRGIHKVDPKAEVVVSPLADGGEGTVEALTLGLGGSLQKVTVTGPLGKPVEAVYGILEITNTAIVEMAAAAGITLLPPSDKNPLYTTTYGVGELLADAIKKGCRHFIVGIGGSATNDGGVGMLQALGYEFLDEEGKTIPFGAQGLEKLKKISVEKVLPQLSECDFEIACDVTNPLCGEKGCSAVYGPQKGAGEEEILKMDRWLAEYARLTKTIFPKADADFPGTGAAGGLGFGFLAYTKAALRPGIEIVLQATGLEHSVQEADLVITGEGRLDGQTAMGKAPVGVATLAKKYGKAVIAFCGCVDRDAGICNEKGIDAFFPILREVVTLEEAMDKENACRNLEATVEQVMRLWNCGNANKKV